MFTPEEVASLNEYQQSGAFHPFTCGGDRTDAMHLDGQGILLATENGWVCPFCEYRQTWFHDWMGNYAWKEMSASKSLSFLGNTRG